MNFFICNSIYFLSFLIPLSYSCGSFNCPPFGNHAHLTFITRPNLLLTYNTNATSRHTDQYRDIDDLRNSLRNLAIIVMDNLRRENGVTRHQVDEAVAVIREKAIFFEAVYQKNECIYDCNYRHTYAPAGTYYYDGGILKRRVVNGICRSGNIVQEQGEIPTVKIVIGVAATIAGGRIFCQSHWEILWTRIKQKIEQDKRGIVTGSFTIERR